MEAYRTGAIVRIFVPTFLQRQPEMQREDQPSSVFFQSGSQAAQQAIPPPMASLRLPTISICFQKIVDRIRTIGKESGQA